MTYTILHNDYDSYTIQHGALPTRRIMHLVYKAQTYIEFSFSGMQLGEGEEKFLQIAEPARRYQHVMYNGHHFKKV